MKPASKRAKSIQTVYGLRRKVMDKQRRKTPEGRLLHACCLCEKLAPWSDGWRWYGSYQEEEEDGVPVMKFCPSHIGPDVHLMAGPGDAEAAFLREYI